MIITLQSPNTFTCSNHIMWAILVGPNILKKILAFKTKLCVFRKKVFVAANIVVAASQPIIGY